MTAPGPDADTYRETRTVPLDQLTEFPGNAQVGNVPAIAASIRKSGQYRGLIVRELPDGTLVILAGNHTARALALVGRTEARCEIHVCDDATARRINVVDNRAAELGHTDNDLLIEQLSYFDGDLEGTGYTDEFIQSLLEPPLPDPADPAGRSAPDEFPAYDDDIETHYQCPKCAYSWSGKPK